MISEKCLFCEAEYDFKTILNIMVFKEKLS